MDEIKILLKPEFEYYHSLLTSYGEDLVDKIKQKLPTFQYNETSRILEFGSRTHFDSAIVFTDDGQGNVSFYVPSSISITDDGNGNVTIHGVTFADDDNGNVFITDAEFISDDSGALMLAVSSNSPMVDDGSGNVTVAGVILTDDGMGNVFMNNLKNN